jgi:hypothetical protein
VGVFISMGNDCYTKKRNAPKKLRQALEPTTLQQLSELCNTASSHYDASIFLIGGSAKLWQAEERYNLLIQQMQSHARSKGVLVLSGSQLYWSVMVALTGGINTDANSLENILPDKWHPKFSPHNRQHMAKYISQCIYLSMALRVEIVDTPGRPLISDSEYKKMQLLIEEQQRIKGCTIVEETATSSTSTSTVKAVASSPPSDEQVAKKPKTLSMVSLKSTSITVEPTPSSSNNDDHAATTCVVPTSESKADLVQKMVESITSVEVFYPDLDDHIITTEDISLDEWFKYSKELREEWREYYDYRRENRKNGFIRDNVDSIINDVLMKAIFDTSKSLAKVTSTNLDPTKRPVRFRENLAKGLASDEPNRSSSSSNNPPAATTSTSTSSKDHTSSRKEVNLGGEQGAGE